MSRSGHTQKPWRANPLDRFTDRERSAIHRKVGVLLREGKTFRQAYAVAVAMVVPEKSKPKRKAR